MIRIKKEKVLVTPEEIKPSSNELEVIGVLNPGAVRLPNRNIILYARVIERVIKRQDDKGDKHCKYCYSPRFAGKNKLRIELDKFSKRAISTQSEWDFVFKDGTKRLTTISHLRKIILDKTGFEVISIDKKPGFYGLSWDGELGIEDPRITKIEDRHNRRYVMTYVSLSRKANISTSCAVSNDCISWHRKGIIFGEQDKDVVIFPEKVKNKYVAFDRPEGDFEFSPPHIWVAFSPELESWGRLNPVSFSKKDDWDYGKKGAGPPPLKTKRGWLLIYHSIREKTKRENSFLSGLKKIIGLNKIIGLKKVIGTVPREISVYSVGAALFDLQNPKKLIAKSKSPIIYPRKSYERGKSEGKDVVFPTGMVVDENKKDILLFSGGGDRVVTVKKLGLNELLSELEPRVMG